MSEAVMVERSTITALRRSHSDHHSYFGEARRHGLESNQSLMMREDGRQVFIESNRLCFVRGS